MFILGLSMYIFDLILELIFPRTSNEKIIQNLSDSDVKNLLKPFGTTYGLSLCSYQNPLVKAAVTATKFENSFLGAKVLSKIVETWLNELPRKKTIVIPIPLSSKRERERGYNQVTRVIKNIKERNTHGKLEDRLLVRVKNTTPQTTLERKDRLQNLKGAFSVNQRIIKKYQYESDLRVVIFDDVGTTGATLSEAKKIITPHFPPQTEIMAVSFAH